MNDAYSKLQPALRAAGYSCANNAILEPNTLELWVKGEKKLLVEIDHPNGVQIYQPLVGKKSLEEVMKAVL